MLLAFFFVAIFFVPPEDGPGPFITNLLLWLREPLVVGPIRTITRQEAIYTVAILIAFCVSAWNWTDAFIDYSYQGRRRKEGQYDDGEWLAARANFRRESYRLWRVTFMALLGISLSLNWAIGAILVVVALLIYAYSEAVNSMLDRLYRREAYALFQRERAKRESALRLAQQKAREARAAQAKIAALEQQIGGTTNIDTIRE